MATTGSAHRAVKCALNSHKAPLAARFVSVGVSCRRARVHRVASAAAQRREKGDNNEEEKSGEERRRWLAMGRADERQCVQVCVGGDGGRGRRGLMVCDDGGAGGSGGGGGDGGGEIYTGCQPPNNVIALYKLRERGEQRCSTLKPPSAP
ncbi:hypothetical protein ALC57_01739 [Trachymyrmex cornetzi]|uniref:Uncharacterized protein n=1 Tax=Trachymyrmex cornetzi TaxID=471704 RepID=A0A195EKV7_9HYME|nr:hypothetical protein ALC57_01739 [Trachymyrmex cornetzi]